MALYFTKELEETRSRIGVWHIMEEISFIKSESLRKQKLAVKALLNKMFGEKVYLSHHDNGKPYIENSVTNISITHTNEYVAVILDDNLCR